MRVVRMHGDPPVAASIAIALEPTAGTGAGTVSRARDHRDKTLQSYVVLSHLVRSAFEELCEELPKPPGSRLPKIVGEATRAMGSNLAAGSLLLLYYNVAAACHDERVESPAGNGRAALALALRDPASILFDVIREVSPSHVLPSSSSFWPDVRSPLYTLERRRFEARPLGLALRLLARRDPVVEELVTAFARTSRLAEERLSERGCAVPTSSEIDELYLRVCSKVEDYLIFRRRGAERARELKEECAKGRLPELSEEESMGSVADLVAVVLYYVCNECIEEWRASRFSKRGLQRFGR
ncbi:MAG: triphosphoribosyl-dephospho-CoA synthase [Fervidicoccaceae archaeon]